jgi:hypothetical protein
LKRDEYKQKNLELLADEKNWKELLMPKKK